MRRHMIDYAAMAEKEERVANKNETKKTTATSKREKTSRKIKLYTQKRISSRCVSQVTHNSQRREHLFTIEKFNCHLCIRHGSRADAKAHVMRAYEREKSGIYKPFDHQASKRATRSEKKPRRRRRKTRADSRRTRNM